ncbi:unnamed protein product [Chrysoparadoxa australica]
MEYVETNNIFKVNELLEWHKGKYRRIDTAEPQMGNTGLHKAVMLGNAEMAEILLEAGACPTLANIMGDHALHCCWRFWHGDEKKWLTWREKPYLMLTQQDRDDFERMRKNIGVTSQLLHKLLRHGADPDAQRNNGATALHEAAMRGSIHCAMVLLLSKANHAALDSHLVTPLMLAERSGQRDIASALVNWGRTKLLYLDSEFREEWMAHCLDPDASLVKGMSAQEMLSQLHTEQHEESTAVRARGGYTIIDECITGLLEGSSATSLAQHNKQAEKEKCQGRTDRSSISSGTSTVCSSSGSTVASAPPPVCFSSSGMGREAFHDRDTKAKAVAGHRNRLGVSLEKFLEGNRADLLRMQTKKNLTEYEKHKLMERLKGEAKVKEKQTYRDRIQDGFGRPMTKGGERRLCSAEEVATDALEEGPKQRPSTTTALLTTRMRRENASNQSHYIYGQRLLSKWEHKRRTREAKIKPSQVLGKAKAESSRHATEQGVYLNEYRMSFNPIELLPVPTKDSDRVPGNFHSTHPRVIRKAANTPSFSRLRSTHAHDDVFQSTYPDDTMLNWEPDRGFQSFEPLVRENDDRLGLKSLKIAV